MNNYDINLYKEKVIELADMCLDFAKVDRKTLHQDGVRSESDTDHTVMLSIISVTIADTLYRDKLNIGLISQFAMVHDLVEVYAGDTDTLINTTAQDFIDKDNREKESLKKIKNKFDNIFPYISSMIERYERQEEKETKFVKVCDKIMSKITNILNSNTYPKSKMTRQELANFLNNQLNVYKTKHGDSFPELFVLFEELNTEMLNKF